MWKTWTIASGAAGKTSCPPNLFLNAASETTAFGVRANANSGKCDESGMARDESGTGWDESGLAWDESAARASTAGRHATVEATKKYPSRWLSMPPSDARVRFLKRPPPDPRAFTRRGAARARRRTLTTGILPFVRSMLSPLRHPGSAEKATPAPGHGQPLAASRSTGFQPVCLSRFACESGRRSSWPEARAEAGATCASLRSLRSV